MSRVASFDPLFPGAQAVILEHNDRFLQFGVCSLLLAASESRAEQRLELFFAASANTDVKDHHVPFNDSGGFTCIVDFLRPSPYHGAVHKLGQQSRSRLELPPQPCLACRSQGFT